MKICANCNINIGGNVKSCPLCQNLLQGDSSHDNWPLLNRFKRQAFFYKLQLFIALSAVAVAMSLDFLIELNDGRHWSLIVALGILMTEMLVKGFVKRSVVAKIVSISVLHVAVILVLTGWYFGFFEIVMHIIIPIMVMITLIANFIFVLIDKKSDAMIYLLLNIGFGIIPYICFIALGSTRSITWTICLMLSIVVLIGIVVFKGAKVISELERRMSI